MAAPIRAPAVLSQSFHERGCIAANTPTGIATSIANASPRSPIWHGGQDAGTDDVPHSLVVQVGPAEIAGEEIAEPDEVLHVERPVEPVLGAQLLDELVGDFRERVLDEQLDRVARDEPHQPEDDDRGQEQNGNRREQASNRVLNHPAVLARRRAVRVLDPRANASGTLRLRASRVSGLIGAP